MNFSNKTILVTGGTGSFGKNFIKYILHKFNFKKVVIFSRDELKQFEMKDELSKNKKFNSLRFFLGDIRDKDRLSFALKNIDFVIHAAALKQVDSAEYNPTEYIKTNIIGSQNLIEESIKNNVKKLVALSTDKASSPINLYGATKLCADKIFLASNNFFGKSTFSVVRYGNVNSSRGSVIPFFLEQSKTGILTITEKNMTRFSISLNASIELVIFALKNLIGGEILVPRIKSYNIMDLANTIGPKCKIKFIGKRPGEKLHEELISANDDSMKIQMKDKFILINKNRYNQYKKIINKFNGRVLDSSFSFTSDKNSFLSKKEIKKMISSDFDKNKS